MVRVYKKEARAGGSCQHQLLNGPTPFHFPFFIFFFQVFDHENAFSMDKTDSSADYLSLKFNNIYT